MLSRLFYAVCNMLAVKEIQGLVPVFHSFYRILTALNIVKPAADSALAACGVSYRMEDIQAVRIFSDRAAYEKFSKQGYHEKVVINAHQGLNLITYRFNAEDSTVRAAVYVPGIRLDISLKFYTTTLSFDRAMNSPRVKVRRSLKLREGKLALYSTSRDSDSMIRIAVVSEADETRVTTITKQVTGDMKQDEVLMTRIFGG